MNVSALYLFNQSLRATLKMLAFVFLVFAAIFSASAGYGLLKTLLQAIDNGTPVGMAEFSTHGGLTVVFFVLAGSSAYVAKKCYW
jgi:hypothetical protein